MNSSTDVESRSSRHHLWWKSKYFIYDIMMHILLLAFNVTTFLYVRHHKLPIPGDMLLLVICYGFTGIVGVVSWGFILKYTPEMDFRGGCTDRLSHFLGFIFLIILFYSISPVFALCFGVPFSLLFLSVVIYTTYVLCRPL
ncbi:unnamed protein product [Brassica rapa subsp. narinosa]